MLFLIHLFHLLESNAGMSVSSTGAHFGSYPNRFHDFFICSSRFFAAFGVRLNTIGTLRNMCYGYGNKLLCFFIEVAFFKNFLTEFAPYFYLLRS